MTEYELRISDWSSDVCSSDLRRSDPHIDVGGAPQLLERALGELVHPLIGQRFLDPRAVDLLSLVLAQLAQQEDVEARQRANWHRHLAWPHLREDVVELVLQLAVLDPAEVAAQDGGAGLRRSEEHTSELQSLMRISYAVFCLKKKKTMTM